MIYVLGSINLDMIATGQRLPLPGETLNADHFSTAAGGKGANQALAAARAGANVKMFGAVGQDDFVSKALAELKDANVDLTNVAHVEGSTGIAIILVDAHGENVIVIVGGANSKVDDKVAKEMVAEMTSEDLLLMVQEVPDATLKTALLAAKTKGIKTMLNIAPVTSRTPELAQLADIIVANETEFSLLIGSPIEQDSIKSCAAEWAKDNQKTIILTLGGDGAIGATPSEAIEVSALPIAPVDTVGAGDTFCGYLGAALNKGHALHEALETAAIAGSLACLKPGAQPAIPLAIDVAKAKTT